MKAILSLTLREQEVEVSLTIHDPETDVGIMGPWWEEETIFLDGKIVDWELSQSETEKLCDAVSDYYYGE